MGGQRSFIESRLFCCAALVGACLAVRPATAAGESRWTQLGPPAAPMFARLLFDPGHAYALAPAGVWQSRGGPWRSLQAGLAGPVQALAVAPARPGRLYAVVSELDDSATIRRSDDHGDHWSVVHDLPGLFSLRLQELEADPFEGDTVYWLPEQALYRSRDGGRTFACFPAAGCTGSFPSLDVFTLAPDRPRTLYAVGGSGFYRTDDGGATWSSTILSENGFTPDYLVATRAPRRLYAWSGSPYRGDLTPCFVRSDDEGTTWRPILHHTKCGAPAIDRDDPLTVRMVVEEGGVARLWVSRDGGESWLSAGAVPELGDLYVTPAKDLALATDQGIFRSPGDAGPWRPANRGFAAAQIAAMLPTGRGLLAAPAQPDVSAKPPAVPLMLTEDGGRSWRNAPLVNPLALAADPGDPQRLIASAWRYEGWTVRHSRLLESRDGGHNWRGVVDPQIDLPTFETLAIDPFEPRRIYAGTRFSGFYRSDDGGRTWHDSNAGLRLGGCHRRFCETNWVSTLLPDPRRHGAIAMLFQRQVFTSDDGGSIWRQRGPTPWRRNGFVTALARDGGGALIAIVAGAASRDFHSLGTVYRSTDDGVSWRRMGRLPRPRSSGRLIEAASLVATNAGLFAGTNVVGVLRSTDDGRTWKPFNDGLPLRTVGSLAADGGRLYATVPQNGVYTTPLP